MLALLLELRKPHKASCPRAEAFGVWRGAFSGDVMLAGSRRRRLMTVRRQEANVIGENHQAGSTLEALESICPLPSNVSIMVENKKKETKVCAFQMVCFEPWLQKGVT